MPWPLAADMAGKVFDTSCPVAPHLFASRLLSMPHAAASLQQSIGISTTATRLCKPCTESPQLGVLIQALVFQTAPGHFSSSLSSTSSASLIDRHGLSSSSAAPLWRAPVLQAASVGLLNSSYFQIPGFPDSLERAAAFLYPGIVPKATSHHPTACRRALRSIEPDRTCGEAWTTRSACNPTGLNEKKGQIREDLTL